MDVLHVYICFICDFSSLLYVGDVIIVPECDLPMLDTYVASSSKGFF